MTLIKETLFEEQKNLHQVNKTDWKISGIVSKPQSTINFIIKR